MPYMIAAVVAVGLICSLDLVLTLGVIRRLRQHSRLLSEPRDDSHDLCDVIMPAGEKVVGFSAVTTDGEPMTLDLIQEPTLIGFFSPHCEPCQVQSTRFAELAGTIQGGRDRTLAIVVGEDDMAVEFAARLLPSTRVILEQDAGPVQEAFKVQGVPAMCLVDEHGIVLNTATRTDRLEELPVRAGG